VRKLERNGKPADETQMIHAADRHNGVIYIAGQGANSNGPVGKDDIDSQLPRSWRTSKKLVETGGGNMDSILQLTVFLAISRTTDAMNKIFKTYFSAWRPAAYYGRGRRPAWQFADRDQLYRGRHS